MQTTIDAPIGATLAEVQKNGAWPVGIRDILPATLWPAVSELIERAEKHAASDKVAEAERQFKAGEKRGGLKQFVVKWLEEQVYDADDPAIQIGESSCLREMAEALTAKPMRLLSADLWHIVSDCRGHEREWSQNWHRDPECEDVVKFTLYLSEVDESAGPFEFIRGSHNGKYAALCEPGKYANQSGLACVEANDHLRFIGNAGTMIVAKTNGIHRGGFTEGRSRQSITWTYVPVDSPCRQLYRMREAIHPIAQPRITPAQFDAAAGTNGKHVEKATKKVAIVGKAPSSRMEAPYADESWEIWGLTDLFTVVPRWSRWFELHEIEPRKQKWGAYWDWLKTNHGKPLYIREPHPEVPWGIVYPKRDIVERFGNYFTNSVSWMIALAIHEGFTHISLYGVDMAQHGDGVKSEYAHQRPSCEFFLGVAAGLGIHVSVHEKSDLLKTRRLYAFDSDSNAMRIKWAARQKELSDQLKDVNANLDLLVKRQHVLMGALDDMQWTRQWCEE